MNLKQRIIIATPLICLIIFLTIGYATGIWSPTWLVFSLIPVMPILLYTEWYKNIFAIVVAIVYVISSVITGLWHPLWIMLLAIPVYYILVGPDFMKPRHRIEFREGRAR